MYSGTLISNKACTCINTYTKIDNTKTIKTNDRILLVIYFANLMIEVSFLGVRN